MFFFSFKVGESLPEPDVSQPEVFKGARSKRGASKTQAAKGCDRSSQDARVKEVVGHAK